MEPLLKITSIPIDIEINIKHGKYEIDESTPEVELSGSGNDLQLRANPVSINVDKLKAQASKPKVDQFDKTAEQPSDTLTFTYQGVMNVADSGEANNQNGQPSQQNLAAQNVQRASRTIENIAELIPAETNSDVYWNDGKLGINYNLSSKSAADLRTSGKHNYKFTPGSVELIVNELPRIEIEYTGGPIYFPRSADPNYEPPKE